MTKTQSLADRDAKSTKNRMGSEEDTEQTPVHSGPEKNRNVHHLAHSLT